MRAGLVNIKCDPMLTDLLAEGAGAMVVTGAPPAAEPDGAAHGPTTWATEATLCPAVPTADSQLVPVASPAVEPPAAATVVPPAAEPPAAATVAPPTAEPPTAAAVPTATMVPTATDSQLVAVVAQAAQTNSLLQQIMATGQGRGRFGFGSPALTAQHTPLQRHPVGSITTTPVTQPGPDALLQPGAPLDGRVRQRQNKDGEVIAGRGRGRGQQQQPPGAGRGRGRQQPPGTQRGRGQQQPPGTGRGRGRGGGRSHRASPLATPAPAPASAPAPAATPAATPAAAPTAAKKDKRPVPAEAAAMVTEASAVKQQKTQHTEWVRLLPKVRAHPSSLLTPHPSAHPCSPLTPAHPSLAPSSCCSRLVAGSGIGEGRPARAR